MWWVILYWSGQILRPLLTSNTTDNGDCLLYDQLTHVSQSVDLQLADTSPILYPHFTNTLPTLYQYFTSIPPTFDRSPAVYWLIVRSKKTRFSLLTVHWCSANSQPSHVQHSAISQSTYNCDMLANMWACHKTNDLYRQCFNALANWANPRAHVPVYGWFFIFYSPINSRIILQGKPSPIHPLP